MDLSLPVKDRTVGNELFIKSKGKTILRRPVGPDRPTIVEISGLTIPKNGLDLYLIVQGPSSPLPEDQIVTFGTLYATIMIGDLKIIPR